MKFIVKVHPSAKKEKISKTEEGFEIWVSAPPEKNKANTRIIEMLSEKLNIPKSSIKIKNPSSHKKIIIIPES